MSREMPMTPLGIGILGSVRDAFRRHRRAWTAAGALLVVGIAVRSLVPPRAAGDFAARRGTLEPTVPLVGTLGAERSVVYGAAVPGVELKILWLVEDGRLVQAGEKLIQFDPAPFEHDLDVARARVAELSGEADGSRLALDALKLKGDFDLREKEVGADLAERELSALINTTAPLSAQESGNDVEQRERALEDAQQKLGGLEPFVAEGYVSQEEFHTAVARRDQAAAELRLARAKHAALVRQTNPDLIRRRTSEAQAERREAGIWKEKTRLEVSQAEAAARVSAARLEEAQRQVAEAERKIAACTVVARAAGLAVHSETFDKTGERRKVRVGDGVWGGTTVVTLPDLTRILVEGRVPESEIHHLSPGEKARVRLDAFPDLELRGTLRSIGAVGAAEANSARSFPVVVELEGSDPRFRPGMVARCLIVGASVKDAVYVPIDAVRTDERGTYVVVVPRIGSPSARRVVIGTSTSQYVAIKSGLDAGEVVRTAS